VAQLGHPVQVPMASSVDNPQDQRPQSIERVMNSPSTLNINNGSSSILWTSYPQVG
jgi:hypothetical protein